MTYFYSLTKREKILSLIAFALLVGILVYGFFEGRDGMQASVIDISAIQQK